MKIMDSNQENRYLNTIDYEGGQRTGELRGHNNSGFRARPVVHAFENLDNLKM